MALERSLLAGGGAVAPGCGPDGARSHADGSGDPEMFGGRDHTTVRLLLFPLFVKQIKSQRMQELAPKIKELQKQPAVRLRLEDVPAPVPGAQS